MQITTSSQLDFNETLFLFNLFHVEIVGKKFPIDNMI